MKSHAFTLPRKAHCRLCHGPKEMAMGVRGKDEEEGLEDDTRSLRIWQ